MYRGKIVNHEHYKKRYMSIEKVSKQNKRERECVYSSEQNKEGNRLKRTNGRERTRNCWARKREEEEEEEERKGGRRGREKRRRRRDSKAGSLQNPGKVSA